MKSPTPDSEPSPPILSYQRAERRKATAPPLGTAALLMSLASVISGLLGIVADGDLWRFLVLIMLASAVLSFILSCVAITLNYQRRLAIIALLLTPLLYWIFIRAALRT